MHGERNLNEILTNAGYSVEPLRAKQLPLSLPGFGFPPWLPEPGSERHTSYSRNVGLPTAATKGHLLDRLWTRRAAPQRHVLALVADYQRGEIMVIGKMGRPERCS